MAHDLIRHRSAFDKAFLFRDIADRTALPWSEDLDLLNRHNVYFETRWRTHRTARDRPQIRYQVYCLNASSRIHKSMSMVWRRMPYDGRSCRASHSPPERRTDRHRAPGASGYEHSRRLRGRVAAAHGIDWRTMSIHALRWKYRASQSPKSFRRRSHRRFGISGDPVEQRSERIRQGNLPCHSLMQFVARHSVQSGAKHWVGAMESAAAHVAQHGPAFHQYGPRSSIMACGSLLQPFQTLLEDYATSSGLLEGHLPTMGL